MINEEKKYDTIWEVILELGTSVSKFSKPVTIEQKKSNSCVLKYGDKEIYKVSGSSLTNNYLPFVYRKQVINHIIINGIEELRRKSEKTNPNVSQLKIQFPENENKGK